MKIKISKSMKLIISILLIAGIGILGVLALGEGKSTSNIEEEKIKYQYTYGTNIDYTVNLVPNILYGENKLPEDQTYITEFIKDISTGFKIDFSGQGAADIQGDYEVVAQVVGYTSQQETKQEIWKKEFVLANKEPFTAKENYTLEKVVTIDFHKYNELSKAIIEASKVNVPVELRVVMRGNLVATNTYGTINKPIETSLILPLGSNYFTIVEAGVGKNTESIKETIQIPVPMNKKMIGLYIGGIVVLLIALAGVWLLTTLPTEEDLRRKGINKILTEHGSRMVAVEEIPKINCKEHYEVGSIEDLVKIADELEKPLLYKYSKEPLDIKKFYVMDENVRYSYQLKAEVPVTERIDPGVADNQEENL